MRCRRRKQPQQIVRMVDTRGRHAQRRRVVVDWTWTSGLIEEYLGLAKWTKYIYYTYILMGPPAVQASGRRTACPSL
jgi:hypothetical protein